MDKDAIALEMQEAGSARKAHDQKFEEEIQKAEYARKYTKDEFDKAEHARKLIRDEFDKAERARKLIRDEFDKAEYERLRVLKRGIFNWLDGIAVEDIKEEIFDRHHHGTGMWLFGQTEFNAWSRGAPSLLWVTGKPGSGVYGLSTFVHVDGIAVANLVLYSPLKWLFGRGVRSTKYPFQRLV